MNKTTTLAVIAALALPSIGFCAYPSLEEASSLFSSNQLNSTNVWLTSQSYSDFRSRLCEPASNEESCAVENHVICAITSIVMHVSTNTIDESCGISIANDRGSYFRVMSGSFRNFSTNSIECLALASYLGHVVQVDFPSNLTMMRGPLVGRKMFISTNSAEMAQWRMQEEAARLERESRLREILLRRDLQLRVAEANRAIEGYRRDVFAICARSVAGCMGVMDADDFAAFTNQVVTVSGANEQERKVLFKYIAPTTSPSSR